MTAITRTKQEPISSITTRFERSVAVIVGIDRYANGIPQLKTAANDATRLAAQLENDHAYDVRLLTDEQATSQALRKLLLEDLVRELTPDDRLIFYFAGHGVALDGDDGPNGYLLPQDARRGEEDTYLFMPFVHDALLALPVRHALIIMDSCFSGAFRWAATRDATLLPEVIHRERFDRFVKDPAWQVITSAAHDQKAMDQLVSGSLGSRPDQDGHSPFALALFEALAGRGDVVPAGAGDGLITATELYLYLESRLQPETLDQGARQTPRLWPLSRHDKGEFVFAVPGADLSLPEAPPLDLDNNPYRGLEAYEKKHAPLFFGRDKAIAELTACVQSRAFTAVLGASGTGKSSLVKAGLLPKLDADDGWCLLPVVRPKSHPLAALAQAFDCAATSEAIAKAVSTLTSNDPERKWLLLVDQLEELITMTESPDECDAVLRLLADLIDRHGERLRLIVTLRTDFEPRFRRGALSEVWPEARYIVQPMTQDELRDVVDKPASARVLYFKPGELVDKLINEVVATPGGLPLLSFALSEMYVHYVSRGSDDRAIEPVDYEAVGGVVGSLRNRADHEYKALDAPHRQCMRRIMLRMVAVGGGGAVARRRVLRSELTFDDPGENERVKTIIDRLVAARLLVMGNEDKTSADDGSGERFVEPAHDALVRAWDRLIEWIHEENRDDLDDLRFQRKLALDAAAWQAAADKRLKGGLLWRDPARSAALSDLLKKKVAWMNAREHAFAQRSVRSRRRFKQYATALGVLMTLLALGAVTQAYRATQERDRATARGLVSDVEYNLQRGEVNKAVQIARGMYEHYSALPAAEHAIMAIGGQPTASLLWFQLGADDVRARFADGGRLMVGAFESSDRYGVELMDWLGGVRPVARGSMSVLISRGGKWLLTEDVSAGMLLDSASGVGCGVDTRFLAQDLSQPIDGDLQGSFLSIPPSPQVFDGNDSFLTTCDTDILLGSLRTGEYALLATVDGLLHADFDSQGNVLAASALETRVYDTNGVLLHTLPGQAYDSVPGWVATVEDSGEASPTVRVWDEDGNDKGQFAGVEPVLSPHARRVAFLTADGALAIVDRAAPDRLDANARTHDHAPARVTYRGAYRVGGQHPRFSSDGSLLMTTVDDERTVIWLADTGEKLYSVDGVSAAFAPGLPAVMTVTGGNRVNLWDLRRLPSNLPMSTLEPPTVDEARLVDMREAQDLAARSDEPLCNPDCLSDDGRTSVSPLWEGAPGNLEFWFEVVYDGDPLPPDPTFQGGELHPEWACRGLADVAFSPAQDKVLTACTRGIQAYRFDGELLQSWQTQRDVLAVSFSDDGEAVLSMETDYAVRVRRLGEPSDEIEAELAPHDAAVAIAVMDYSGMTAAASVVGTIYVYGPDYGVVLESSLAGEEIVKLHFSDGGGRLWAYTASGLVKNWTLWPEHILRDYDWVPDILEQDWDTLLSR